MLGGSLHFVEAQSLLITGLMPIAATTVFIAASISLEPTEMSPSLARCAKISLGLSVLPGRAGRRELLRSRKLSGQPGHRTSTWR